LLYIFLEIYNLKIILEYRTEGIVVVCISGIVVVTIASVVVAVVVIASTFHARIVGIAIGFDLSLIFNFLIPFFI